MQIKNVNFGIHSENLCVPAEENDDKEKEVNNKSKVKTKKNKEAKLEDGIIIKEYKGNKGNNKEIKEKKICIYI